MTIKTWIEWWLFRNIVLKDLAKKELVLFEELEICFRLQNKVCEGVG